MIAYTFEAKPVTSLEFGAPGGPTGQAGRVTKAGLRNIGKGCDRSAVFGKGSDCPKALRSLYEACNRAMLAGDIAGFWLPRELAGTEMPWVIESADLIPRGSGPCMTVRMSSADLTFLVKDHLTSEVPAAKVAQPRPGRRVKVEPKITVSRTVEVERPEPVNAVDAFYPPPAPTVQVVESVVFPEALAAYLGRLVFPPKRQYAEQLARWSLGMGDLPVKPAKDWADDVDRKVAKHLGRELVSA